MDIYIKRQSGFVNISNILTDFNVIFAKLVFSLS